MIHLAGLTLPGLRRSLQSTKMEKVVLPKGHILSEDGNTGNDEASENEEKSPEDKVNTLTVKDNDIIISADLPHQLPEHFRYTLERLELDYWNSSSSDQ